ncbi:MAG: hypothetical protein VBE63_15370 [Lamprobacter sp.]|uniref:hypothetical protein n=1 Tax=Lamprobacter sp. TaxID=3100796 RepID=UPI002B25A906|nr:hypothetical protein [Lamprobacter sp.]MEA3641304.1 hypothetical protein [Lamprobacter sp.]
MQAVPKAPPKHSKAAFNKGANSAEHTDTRTRKQQLEAAHGDDIIDLDMPPLDPADLCQTYISMLFEAGPVLPGGMGGATALTWQELDAWASRTDQRLTPEEFRLLRRLSGVYASASHRMSEHDAKSPWLEQLAEHHQRKQAAIKAAFDRMARLSQRQPTSRT